MSATTDYQSASSANAYARAAGILFLLSIIGGGFGEAYAPGAIIVSGDATATASNVINHAMLFRMGYAAYLLEAACDITLAWIFYILLRPVNKNLALLTAFFGILSTATFAGTELFYFAPSFILDGSDYLKTFTPAQLNSLALLSFKFYAVGAAIFMAFYGIGWILRGYLIYKSGYFPRWLGVLLGIAGVGFVAHNLAVVLAPAYKTDLLTLPMAVGALALTIWLFAKGVDATGWEARAKAA